MPEPAEPTPYVGSAGPPADPRAGATAGAAGPGHAAADEDHLPEPDHDPLATSAGWGRWRWAATVLLGGAVLAGIVLRFVTRSPLWLDEALSVNIARLPIADIPGALRHDGHPPLYYVLLHDWMAVFGESSGMVRLFSGLWSLALFPLVWVAATRVGGRRVAIYATALLALSPFAIRYATETRMYAMVSVLTVAGWLLADDALRRPHPVRLAGIAALTGLVLWTHYWAMWFLGAAVAGLVLHGWRARRDGRTDSVRATVAVVGAMVVGGLLFLPWLPSLLYQGAHTGTPWARPVRPTEMVTNTLTDFGGGPTPEAMLLGWLLGVLVVIGLCGRAVDRFHVSLDVRTRPAGRPFAVLVAGTLGIACVVGYATGATYATRYASVLFPFVIVLAALGVDQFRSRPVAFAVLAVVLALGGLGGVLNVVKDRSDARRSADAITARAKAGDWVVYCPDQLGPATSRLVEAGLRQVTYPDFAPPARVDWVDYKARLDRTPPEAFAQALLDRAGDAEIFLVYSADYTTHRQRCPALYNALAAARTPEVLTQPTDVYEPASVVAFTPRPAGS